MSTLILLFCLIASVVATPTAELGFSCRQEIPPDVVRQLWSMTNRLINKLPKEEGFSRRLRLLPKFCTKCSERAIGWLEIKEIVDVYQSSVFSRDVIKELFPLHYNELLHRLQHTLLLCVSSSKPSKYFKTIKKMGRKIKKRRDKGALKAVREFTFILGWIDELAGYHSH